MTSPWSTCIHGDDPTICARCWPELEAKLAAAEERDQRPRRLGPISWARVARWRLRLRFGRSPF